MKQAEGLALLLAGEGVQEVARQLQCSRNLVWKWVTENPLFREVYLELKADLTEHAAARMKCLAAQAVEALAKSLDAKNEVARIMAANSILDRCGLDGKPRPDERDRVWSVVFAATSWERPA